ncbi:MAG TPA: hypothetical protein VIP77_05795 [Jiangellaceae bacterium]
MTSITYRQAGRVTRDLGWGLWQVLIMFAGIVVLIFGGIGVVMAVTGSFDGSSWDSVWENSAYATRYFPLAMGIMLTAAYLPVCIASGMTRRAFGLGASAIVVGMALVMAVLEAAGYLVEDLLFTIGGGTQQFTSPHLFDAGTDVLVIIAEVSVLVAAHVAVGWSIGTAYYTSGWFWPTIMLPFMLVPIALVEGLMSVGWAGSLTIDTWGWDRVPLDTAIPLSLAVIALTLWANQLAVRSIDIRPQRS